jgi:valyl-tRNA synthetase
MAVFKRESLMTARRMLPPPKGVIDLAAERARPDKELTKADADSGRVDARLGNEKFAADARRKSSRKKKKSAKPRWRGRQRSSKRWSG